MFKKWFSETSNNKWVILLLLVGFVLRFSIFLSTPSYITFDNHFEPIMLWLKNGHIPLPNECFQCYQPPLYYSVFYFLAQIKLWLGFEVSEYDKVLQFGHLIIGMATLLVSWLVIKQFKIDKKAKLLSFAILVFLPKHIYMSVMFSNDTLVYFSVVLVAYFLLKWKNKPTWSNSIFLGISITAAVFSKGNGLVVLPATAAAVLLVLVVEKFQSSRFLKAVVIAFIPLLLYTPYVWQRHQLLGNPYKMNVDIFNIPMQQQPGAQFDYVSFKPWEFVKMPTIYEGNMHSFFTMIYSRMWVEGEAKFSVFIDHKVNENFWIEQSDWYGDYNSPIVLTPEMLTLKYRISNGILVILGLLPLLSIIIGLLISLKISITYFGKDSVITLFLLLLVVGNIIGIYITSSNFPFYSFVKAAFFLVSIPAFLVFSAKGLEFLLKNRYSAIMTYTGIMLLLIGITIQVYLVVEGALYA